MTRIHDQPGQLGSSGPLAESAGSTRIGRYETMALIRAFETRVGELYRANEIPGFVHTSLGQEAVAAGVCGALRVDDAISTTHRGHGHCLAKGADLDGMMAELFAKATGLNRGKGGSMHVADLRVGVLGANGIVGGGIALAVGAALSSVVLDQGRVAVAFFGEGAVNQGAFHESINLAAVWNLPVLFACENNLYAEFTASSTMARVESVADRAAGYGVPAATVDGNDADAVHAAAAAAVARLRAGDGPELLELQTYRHHGHYEGDGQAYKPAEEIAAWAARDPLHVLSGRLLAAGEATADDIAAWDAAAADRVERAIEQARAAPEPDAEEALTDVYGD